MNYQKTAFDWEILVLSLVTDSWEKKARRLTDEWLMVWLKNSDRGNCYLGFANS